MAVLCVRTWFNLPWLGLGLAHAERGALLRSFQINTGAGTDELATCYGAKPAALARFLKEQVLATEGKAIVFSMWDDVLHIIAQTLKELEIPSLFCEGDGKAKDKAIRDFTSSPHIPVLMLSACA